MKVDYASRALRDLKRFSKADQNLILLAIDVYSQTGLGDVRALKGRLGHRLRVGDLRVLFEFDRGSLTVSRIVRRSERTYR